MKRLVSLLALSMVLVAGTSRAQLCNFGTFSVDGQEPCQNCPAGTYGNAQGLTSCPSCSPGTFSSALGSTTSSTCQDCPFGRFSGSPAAAICDNCPPGTYGPSLGLSVCENCAAGTYSSTLGSTTASSCQDCDIGKYGPTAGATSASACLDCPEGQYGPSTGLAACEDCAPGTFSLAIGATTAATCQDCEAGSYQDQAGQGECLDCADGTRQPDLGQVSCVDRPQRRCWKAKDLKNPAFVKQAGLSVTDEVASSSVDILGVRSSCEVAGLDGSPVAPGGRQCCYKAKGEKLAAPVSLALSGALGGDFQVRLLKVDSLCEQCSGAPIDEPVRCWKVKDLKNPAFAAAADVAVTDTFATDTVDVTSPTLFCSPASVDGSPLTDTKAQQCCYKTKGAKLSPSALVGTLGSIGGTLELELGSQSMVCEPCTASVLP